MKARIILILWIIPGIILTACNPEPDISESDAEKGVTAYFNGDLETIAEYFCEDQQLSAEEAELFIQINIQSIACKADGSNMRCDVTARVTATTAEAPDTTPQLDADAQPDATAEAPEKVEVTRSYLFLVTDGKLCGVIQE